MSICFGRALTSVREMKFASGLLKLKKSIPLKIAIGPTMKYKKIHIPQKNGKKWTGSSIWS